MEGTVSFELSRSLLSDDLANREAAWDELIRRHTRLLLAVARSFGGDHDEVMDRYAFVLEKLRESDFRRLTAFREDAGASFATWLTFVARRLCLDQYRARHGRWGPKNKLDRTDSLRALRAALNFPAHQDISTDLLQDPGVSADDIAVSSELHVCLRTELALLSPREQLLITLRFEDDLPASRIARVLRLPSPFHVYRQVNRILARLRAALESHGIEGSDG